MAGAAIAARWRDLTGPIPDAVELSFMSSLFAAGEPINVQLQGRDTASLRTAADTLKARLLTYPGVFDVTDSFRGGEQELKLSILPSARGARVVALDLASPSCGRPSTATRRSASSAAATTCA